jgi:hypothetical protein
MGATLKKKKKKKNFCGHSWGLNLFPRILLKTEWSSNQLSQFDNSQKFGTLGGIYFSHL